MDTLPDNWLALASLVLILGMKHGFDADHLATIDGLTRFNSRRNPGLARYCGTLFSLGHGAIVIAIALAVGTLADVWQVPEWFEWVGGLISIAFLTLLGAVNLRAVLAAAPGEMVRPAGIKGRFLGRLTEAGHPLLVAAVGALFALSFDTLSQAALFAFTATRHGGWEHALGLSLLFMLGMLITDGINGLWISRLIARADTVALVASRVMGLVVSAVSLLVAAFGAAKMLSPAVEAWSDGKELAFGFALVCIIAASFLLALRLARRPLPA
ncbi:HoxN/HupN/NixA family nickel/cobalt transporter [Azospira sp. I09]|uniref:HoxN/HupN/NixA family nickel/cobalt transporter n=1 Tax=Azospira sp. I09 TaxID=1765049 RepID=UPI001260CCF8|nr:nickel transporter [Azospira sp. I09]BBN89770.1 nickel/cobalt efflux system [Azospira sp. I09]